MITATFLPKGEKLTYITKAIIKLDLLKFFILLIHDLGSLDMKKFIPLSKPLEEAGKMLGGWKNQNIKQNSPA